MSSPRPRLILIDGYSNIFRAFYAIRNLSNSKGEPTNAVYGFLQIMRKLLQDETPDYVGVAFDVSGPTIRDEKFEDYKANRAPMPEELKLQIPLIRQVIEAHRIPILEHQGYEADDVLGTLAKQAAAAGFDVVLVSADKDLMQLVDQNVWLQHTGRNKLYDPAGVEEDFGVPPDRVVDVLALKGDAVDNVPGVPGIGEKGAVQLVRDFGSLEEILQRVDEVGRKSYREGLQNHRDMAELSKELVTIHTDLPIEFDPDALSHDEPDVETLRKLYRDLEFRSLLEALEGSGEPETGPQVLEIRTAAEWSEQTSDLASEIWLGVVGDPEVVGLAISGPDQAVRFADFRHQGLRAAVLESLESWLLDKEKTVVGHDLKELLRLCDGVDRPAAELLDTMLLSYVLRPSLRSHELPAVTMERLGISALDQKAAGWKGSEPPLPGHEPLLALAGERASLPGRLVTGLQVELADGRLQSIYDDIELPLMPVLMLMEEAGVLLDCAFLNAMSERLDKELVSLESEIFELAGESFNINSPKQLGVILFEKLGYPVIKKTRKTKSYSTSAEILQLLATQGLPLPERILRYRETGKLKSTYVDALPALVDDAGRVHTRFQQAVAATGRLSSINPNLQNIPIRTEAGQQIRKAFIAPEGAHLLVADYNQIELRVLAHISGDSELIADFKAGADIHRSTAGAVFGVAPELVSSEQRRAAKMINFGIIYGISGFGLGQRLGIPPAEADQFIRAYLERYAGVKRYMDETLASAEADGRVETLYGRVRWLPEIRSSNHNRRENARRMAINARIQGTAADLLKKAMISLDAQLRRHHVSSRLVLTVHDELVLEVPIDEVEAVSKLVKAEMEGVESLAVPLAIDIGSGPTWYEAKT